MVHCWATCTWYSFIHSHRFHFSVSFEFFCKSGVDDPESPRRNSTKMERGGPLQDAWAREVQRRHMRTALLRRGSSSAAASSHASGQWRDFETARPASRFANFSRYGYAIGEVPEAVTDDFVTFLELSQADATWLSGRQHVRQPGSTAGLSDAEFAVLQDVTSSSELAGLEECAICLNAVSAATPCKSLPCGHAFHA